MALREHGVIVMSGWLKKLPSRKLKWTMTRLLPSKFERRYVVLRTAFERSGVCSVSYYEQQEDADADHNLRGSLLVHGLTVLFRKSDTKFGLQSNEKEIVFMADTPTDADRWCNEIERVIRRAAGGLAGSPLIIGGIDHGRSRGRVRSTSMPIGISTSLDDIDPATIIRKGWLYKSKLSLSSSSTHKFEHQSVKVKSKRYFVLVKSTVNGMKLYHLLYFKKDTPNAMPKRIFHLSTHSYVAEYMNAIRVQVERGVGLYVTSVGTTDTKGNQKQELEIQREWFRDLRAATSAIKVARVISSNHLMRNLALNAREKQRRHKPGSQPPPPLKEISAADEDDSMDDDFDDDAPATPDFAGLGSGGSIARRLPIAATYSKAPPIDSGGGVGTVSRVENLAPLLLIENYELISEFIGGDAGAFHLIFCLNKFCAAHCDTVVERFIECSGEEFDKLTVATIKFLTIPSLTNEVARRFGYARAQAHAVTIQAFVHHRIYCEAQQRMEIELHRHDKEKAKRPVQSANQQQLSRAKSVRSYSTFTKQHCAETTVEPATEALTADSIAARPAPRRTHPKGLASVLNDLECKQIDAALPSRLQCGTWDLKFATCRHGYSLATLYERIAEVEQPLLFVILDSNDRSFGTFCTAKKLRPSSEFVGTGESFIFKCCPHFEVFRWTQANQCFALAEHSCIAFGSGGGFGIWLDNDLEYGVSQTCATYGNTPLSNDESFEIVHIEIWAIS